MRCCSDVCPLLRAARSSKNSPFMLAEDFGNLPNEDQGQAVGKFFQLEIEMLGFGIF